MAGRSQVSAPSFGGSGRRAVIIVINALQSGGAELTCVELVRHLRETYEVEVVGLLRGGPAECELRALGVQVVVPPAASGGWTKLRQCWTFARLLRSKRPLAVITFLYVADLVGGALARLLTPRASVYWNIRNNVLARTQMGAFSYAAARLNAFISPVVPSAIVYCSSLSKEQHESVGFRSRRSYVVENSLESVPFAFSATKRAAFRTRLARDAFLFLFAGRFDPVKRVDAFIDACARVQCSGAANVRFLIAGQGMEWSNPQLASAVQASGIAAQFELLGYVSDRQALYSGADCLIVTSESEGSPNVIYEAMATRLQSVILATVGTETVSGYGVLRLSTRNPEALVDAMTRLAARGVPADAERVSTRDAFASAGEHPLVTFYKRVLPNQ
jgi:glycosyltransferase involved in cell wall biosynthesis